MPELEAGSLEGSSEFNFPQSPTCPGGLYGSLLLDDTTLHYLSSLLKTSSEMLRYMHHFNGTFVIGISQSGTHGETMIDVTHCFQSNTNCENIGRLSDSENWREVSLSNPVLTALVSSTQAKPSLESFSYDLTVSCILGKFAKIGKIATINLK